MLQFPVRFLTLQLLMLWQGGFLFYAVVVVPVGGSVLGSETTQGFITQRVTWWLNLIGLFAIVIYGIDSQLHCTRRIARIVLAGSSLAISIGLIGLHDRLGTFLDTEQHIVNEPASFYRWHAVYLTLSGVQWFAMLIALVLMLLAWRDSDVQQRN